MYRDLWNIFIKYDWIYFLVWWGGCFCWNIIVYVWCKIVNIVCKLFIEICSGVDVFFIVLKVVVELNILLVRWEIMLVFVIDIVIIGWLVYCFCIFRVVVSNVSILLVFCGISVILGILVLKDCILCRWVMIFLVFGVLWKLWLDMIIFILCVWV